MRDHSQLFSSPDNIDKHLNLALYMSIYLLGAPGIATRSKKLLGVPGITTGNKKLLGKSAANPVLCRPHQFQNWEVHVSFKTQSARARLTHQNI